MRIRALERLLGPIASWRVECSPYASSHPLELVWVRLADGAERRVVLKDPDRVLAVARDAKPPFLRAPGRELQVYRSVLVGTGIDAPELLGVADGLLVLEHVEGAPLVEVGDLGSWEHAARTIAAMHRQLAGHAGDGLPRLDAPYFARWLERARTFRNESLGEVAGPFRAAVARAVALPTTVVHGELYAPNVRVRPDGRVCLLDWETAAIGPGLLDLAALTSGAFTEAGRERIVAAYANELGCEAHELVADLECCRLLIAIQWLGWSDRWAPPPIHAHDWRREAVRAAKSIP